MLTRFKKLKLVNVFWLLLGVFIFVFYYPKTIHAENVVWENYFNSATDLSNWIVKNESNETLINNGLLELKQIDNFKMVFLQRIIDVNNNSNLKIEIKFRYQDNNYDYGAGIGFNDHLIANRSTVSLNLSDRTIVVWTQTSKRFAVATSICLQNAYCANNDYTNSKPIIMGGNDFSSWHILEVFYQNNRYKILLDGNYAFETKQTSRKPNYLWIGNPQITWGPVIFSLLDIDYIKVVNLDNNSSSFPYLSQKDPRWGSEEYDHASTWAPNGHQSIANWGCALTSSAMIFQHFGVKSPTGQETTPLILNNWLNNQNDGYIGEGLVNWIALTRYAKESRDAGQSPTSLEVTMSSYDPNNHYETPNIINLPGHFVVGYDQDSSNFKIKDPADETKTLLAKTGSSIKRINRFIPSNTDLSYFMFTIDSRFDLELKDDNGNSIGQLFNQEPLVDDLDSNSTTSGQTLKTLLVAKPPQGNFHLWVTNPNQTDYNYSLKEYFYDQNGQVEIKQENEHLLGQHTDVYDFSYQGAIGSTKTPITINSIQQILKTHFNNSKMKQFYYHFVNNWLEKAKSESDSQKQKEIMQALKRVVENNTTLIEDMARVDIQTRINQWLLNH